MTTLAEMATAIGIQVTDTGVTAPGKAAPKAPKATAPTGTASVRGVWDQFPEVSGTLGKSDAEIGPDLAAKRREAKVWNKALGCVESGCKSTRKGFSLRCRDHGRERRASVRVQREAESAERQVRYVAYGKAYTKALAAGKTALKGATGAMTSNQAGITVTNRQVAAGRWLAKNHGADLATPEALAWVIAVVFALREAGFPVEASL